MPGQDRSAGPFLLALDAGGSRTQALLLDGRGECRGYGTSAAGNATSAGTAAALDAMRSAASDALRQAGQDGAHVGWVVMAAAGARHHLTDAAVTACLRTPGAALYRVSDLLAMYYSGAVEHEGLVLVGGTGAAAAHIEGTEITRAVDGTGWLLGDNGSGFWIGRKAARAVAAHLDGTAPATRLTAPTLAQLGISSPADHTSTEKQPAALEALVEKIHRHKPGDLARLAPLVFRLAPADPVAAAIADAAENALARTLRTVRTGRESLPVVLGGSVLSLGIRARGGGPLMRDLSGADVRWAEDGIAGAAAIGLRMTGHPATPSSPGALRRAIAACQLTEGRYA